MADPTFGDRIEGVHASSDNPHKFGTFVEVVKHRGGMNPGTFYRVTDGKGEFWMYPEDWCIVHRRSPTANDRAVEKVLAWCRERLDDHAPRSLQLAEDYVCERIIGIINEEADRG